MKIYITKVSNNSADFRYIAKWVTETGNGYSDTHRTLKDLKEYFQSWDQVEFIRVNF